MTLKYPPFANNARIVQAANSSPWFKWGERGPGVAILQGALIDCGCKLPISTRKTGAPDGIYGNETYHAVLKFQTDSKLAGKDGIAGRETIRALDRKLAGKGKTPPPKPKPPPTPPTPPSATHYKIGTSDPVITHDPGAGPYNSKPVEYTYISLKAAIIAILPPQSNLALLATGANACRHMYHYFGKTGSPLTINLESMVVSGPTAKARFRDEVRQAQIFSETLGPGTHRITSKSAISAYNWKSESRDWFFAIGGYSSWGKGTVTVTGTGAAAQYDLDFEYKMEDKYNWDGGKSVTIGGITVTDHFMGEFHRQGLAKEYICRGSIRRRFTWQKGQTIPPQQYRRGGR